MTQRQKKVRRFINLLVLSLVLTAAVLKYQGHHNAADWIVMPGLILLAFKR